MAHAKMIFFNGKLLRTADIKYKFLYSVCASSILYDRDGEVCISETYSLPGSDVMLTKLAGIVHAWNWIICRLPN